MKTKKLVALGLATTVAVGAALATAGSALAYPPPPHHHHHNGGPPFSFGFSFGPAFFFPPYQPYYYEPQPYLYLSAPGPYADASPHVQWCLSHYRTYNPSTNTYWRKVGVAAVCVSPFRY